MRKPLIATTLPPLLVAVFAAGESAAQAQNPPAQTPQTPSTTVQPTTTLAGCLYREDQVPGRKPNVVERAGILEDYILADASVANTAKPETTPRATGTSGTMPASGNMYK